MNSRRSRLIRERRTRRQTIGNSFGRLIVQRRRRSVRITAITNTASMTGAPCAASFGFVDLDDAGVDRLIERLRAIRGGKRALP